MLQIRAPWSAASSGSHVSHAALLVGRRMSFVTCWRLSRSYKVLKYFGVHFASTLVGLQGLTVAGSLGLRACWELHSHDVLFWRSRLCSGFAYCCWLSWPIFPTLTCPVWKIQGRLMLRQKVQGAMKKAGQFADALVLHVMLGTAESLYPHQSLARGTPGPRHVFQLAWRRQML